MEPAIRWCAWFTSVLRAALTAFGGGALVCAPLSEKLMQHFAQVPDMIGNIANTPVVTKAGAKFVEVGGQMKEVIQITGDNLNVRHFPAQFPPFPPF